LKKPVVWLLIILGTTFCILVLPAIACLELMPIFGVFWHNPTAARHELLVVPLRHGAEMEIYVRPLVARLYHLSFAIGMMYVAVVLLAGLITKLISLIAERRNRYRSDWMSR
jgi:hypothetical protein